MNSYISDVNNTANNPGRPTTFQYVDRVQVDPMKLSIRQQNERPTFWPQYRQY